MTQNKEMENYIIKNYKQLTQEFLDIYESSLKIYITINTVEKFGRFNISKEERIKKHQEALTSFIDINKENFKKFCTASFEVSVRYGI